MMTIWNMHDSFTIRGLYAVTPDTADLDSLIQKTELAIEGGVTIIQYRSKIHDHVVKMQQCDAILRLCSNYDVLCIVNDDVDLCCALGAHGVHLGKTDKSIEEARLILGPDAMIGVSCYNELPRALHAESLNASYVAFGAVYPTLTKPYAPRVSLDFLKEARLKIDIPIVAIGGIDVNNAKDVIKTGIDAIAVITSLYEANSIKETAETLSSMFH